MEEGNAAIKAREATGHGDEDAVIEGGGGEHGDDGEDGHGGGGDLEVVGLDKVSIHGFGLLE